MAFPAFLTPLVPLAVQPVQDTNHDAWWKWVAIALILLLVVPTAAILLLTVRSWITED